MEFLPTWLVIVMLTLFMGEVRHSLIPRCKVGHLKWKPHLFWRDNNKKDTSQSKDNGTTNPLTLDTQEVDMYMFPT